MDDGDLDGCDMEQYVIWSHPSNYVGLELGKSVRVKEHYLTAVFRREGSVPELVRLLKIVSKHRLTDGRICVSIISIS